MSRNLYSAVVKHYNSTVSATQVERHLETTHWICSQHDCIVYLSAATSSAIRSYSPWSPDLL